MKLYRKLRKRGTKTASGPSSGPSSDTRTDETRNSPKSAGRVDEPSQPSDIPGPNPADEIPATPVAKTEDTPQSNVHPSPLVVESAAEKALSEAAENLNTKIQKCGMDASEFKLKPIRASYDMNSIAHSLEICLEGIMDKADVSVSNKNAVKTFAKDWGRKAIPFIEKGLDVAEVRESLSYGDV